MDINILPCIPSEFVLLAIPAIFIAGLVHGTFGIGFPMVATPLLALFTDVLTAVIITLIPTIAVNLAMIYQGGFQRFKEIREHLLVIPFALLGTIAGTFLLLWLDPRPFLLLLAFAIVLYLNQDRLKGLNLEWIQTHKTLAYMLFGLVAGIMAGTVNVMLPVLIILFLELRIAAASMVVLFNLNFLTGKATQSLIFLNQNIEGLEPFMLMTLWLIPVALLALYLGSQLRKRISSERYLGILRGVLWLMSGILGVRFVMSYL